jgi:hypothetical protein
MSDTWEPVQILPQKLNNSTGEYGMTIAAEKKKAMPLMFTSEVELVDR